MENINSGEEDIYWTAKGEYPNYLIDYNIHKNIEDAWG